MKIVESQSAVLTNYEVYQHLTEQRQRYKQGKRRGPPNLETVVRELLGYLRTRPNPLSQDPSTYSPECISHLLEGLRPYELSKGEVVMILNLRPADVVALNTVVEDMAERFTEEQQQEIVDVIAQVLGQFESDGAQQADDAADASMNDAATA
ncbi:RNA polymerase rpb4 domain-containing protein [Hirsutella rhossiliensis]|uniref:DNA-directed RNA polymerase III subunit RPC9 n=1 Tax=Hirsutella rhossiliensis TaxID=111463 RepID=A0A9P8MST0_9HYPO|nr:RNA polymerase rpb4 domain-containing protein [Hirsutella rhossiliensis]KAH0960767.1 RNA polymerase rpb4 domain-containing protein [Hirsutella rhossiliensis]